MAYDIDVLITCYTADNHATESDGKWVENVRTFLQMMMTRVLREKPKVLMTSELDDMTRIDLKQVALIVPVISPAFVASEECLATLDEFLEINHDGYANRVFKVLKRPIDVEGRLDRISDLPTYALFNLNVYTEEVLDFNNFFTPEAEHNFWLRLVDLVYDLSEALRALKSSVKTANRGEPQQKPVYLSETGPDLSIQRKIIKRELGYYGYKVLPEHDLPATAEELRQVVSKEIEECQLSIHLIGSSFGRVPEGSDKSVVDIQNEIATEKATQLQDRSEFSRLIWISPHLDDASEKQIAYVENIKRDMASAEAAEILQVSLEDFKNIIREELFEAAVDNPLSNPGSIENQNEELSVYLIYDEIDVQLANSAKKTFQDQGLTVLEPVFKGKFLDVRQHHIENLKQFDAVAIIQDAVNLQWVRMKVMDLLKAAGFGREKPILGKVIVSTQKPELSKSEFTEDIQLIDGAKKQAMDKNIKSFIEDMTTIKS